jgi:hypothetical protein
MEETLIPMENSRDILMPGHFPLALGTEPSQTMRPAPRKATAIQSRNIQIKKQG